MDRTLFLKYFQQQEEIILPGLEAQLLLAPPYRKQLLEHTKKNALSPRDAAVLLCIYPNATGALFFALIRRNVYPGVHSGQISFPGGKVETNDTSFWATALREAKEEIGLNSNTVEQITALSSLYIPPSNFMVYPFIGCCPHPLNFAPDASEVAEIIEIPLISFLHSFPKSSRKIIPGSTPSAEPIPYYELEEKIVWGATAMILSEFQQLMKQLMAA